MTTPTIEARVQEVIALFDAIPNASWSDHHDYRDRAIAALRSLAASATQVPGNKFDTHPHAALMPQYAMDEAQRAKPWAYWEYFDPQVGSWRTCISPIHWNTEFEYRRKPDAPPLSAPATQGEAVRWEYQLRNPGFATAVGMSWTECSKQRYEELKGMDRYEVRALAVINEPAPAPSKEQTNGH